MVLISIVIPTLNEEKHIGRLLQQFNSVELRKKHHFELIVADCHSTDRTVEIAKNHNATVAYTMPGIRPNAARARIAGVQIATGDVLLFLDADGIIDDVDVLLSAATSLLTSKYGCLNCKVHTHPGEAIWKDYIFQYGTNLAVQTFTMLGAGGGRAQCLGIRRDIYEKIGGFNPDFDAAEDFEMFMRARKHTKVKHFSNVIVYESPRRYRKKGYLKTLHGWLLNNASIVLRNKSATTWERVE